MLLCSDGDLARQENGITVQNEIHIREGRQKHRSRRAEGTRENRRSGLDPVSVLRLLLYR